MVAEGSSPPSRTPPASGGDATSRSADSAGAYLQSLRLARGASLDDIARATRVGRRHIEALEADEAAELPAPVFVKGFIRAYCEFLQAKPDEALERYRRHAPVHSPAPRPFGGVRRRPPSRLGSPIAVSLLLLAVLSAALLAVNYGLRSGGSKPASSLVARPTPPPVSPSSAQGEPPAQPTPAAAPGAPTAAAAPEARPTARPVEPQAPPSPSPASSATSGAMSPPSASTPPPAAAGPQPRHRLVARAVEDTWVRVQIDRETVVAETLRAGTSREWTAEQGFVLTIGNAGGLDLTLDGQRLPPLGRSGAVIHELVLPRLVGAPRS